MSLREQKKQLSRNSILKAAEKLINRLGYENAKMRDIAKSANVSYQTLYNYFPTKALIVQSLLMQEMSHLDMRIADLIERYGGKPLTLLNNMVKAQIDAISHRNRDLWREVTIEILSNSSSAQDLYTAIDKTAHQQILQTLALFQQRKELDPYVDIEVLAHTLYVVIDYAILQYLIQPTLSKVALLKELRKQIEVILTPYLRT